MEVFEEGRSFLTAAAAAAVAFVCLGDTGLFTARLLAIFHFGLFWRSFLALVLRLPRLQNSCTPQKTITSTVALMMTVNREYSES